RAPTPSAAAELAVPDTFALMNKFDNVTARLKLLLKSSVMHKRQNLSYLTEHSVLSNPQKLLDNRRLMVDQYVTAMDAAVRLNYTAAKGEFATMMAKLDSLSPLAVLGRGYSMIKDESGAIINSYKQMSIGQHVQVSLSDGQAEMEILNFHENEE
ncbi:MAG: hypothetical protein J6R33_00950, partial [Clostridia bacterium]|nr:hypothetical protein [Clostridia bacterium]